MANLKPKGTPYTTREDKIIFAPNFKSKIVAKRLRRSQTSICNRRSHLILILSSKPLALTQREYNILSMVANGKKNKEISHRLGLDKRTIETHRRNIILKMKAKNFFHAIKLGYDRGILKPEKNG